MILGPLVKSAHGVQPTNKLADFPSARALCDPHGAVGLRDDRSGLLEEHPTGARELHVTARAPEQRRLEFLLQPPDLLAQRWLRDVETRGRPAEVQLLGHGNEVPEVSKLHGWSHIINVLKIPERYIGHSPHPRRPLSSRIGNARMERGTPLKIERASNDWPACPTVTSRFAPGSPRSFVRSRWCTFPSGSARSNTLNRDDRSQGGRRRVEEPRMSRAGIVYVVTCGQCAQTWQRSSVIEGHPMECIFCGRDGRVTVGAVSDEEPNDAQRIETWLI